jgi:starch-binding outer membrane protein, SusD/RagB family
MKSNKIMKIAFVGSLILVFIVACEKKLNLVDTNSPTQESYFKTAVELEKGVNGAYSIIRSTNLLGRAWHYFHSMRGGEVGSGGSQLEVENNELLTKANPGVTNAQVNNIWTACYQMINRANLVIAKGPGVTDNVSLRDRVVGEAKFLRAWAYYELVSQWGDVPMYTEPVTSPSDFKGKEPSANIYTLILSDLADAAAKLPASYSGADLGRATKGAANALAGRANMQKGDYAAAKTALLAVVNSNLYSLQTVPFLWNFDGDIKTGSTTVATGNEFNKESVFEVVFVDKGDNGFGWGGENTSSTAAGSTVRAQDWGTTWGNVVPSTSLLEEFGPDPVADPRYKWTFWEEGDMVLTKGGTQTGVPLTDFTNGTSTKFGVVKKRIFRKYSLNDWVSVAGIVTSGLNYRLIRYADVLLMLAECEVEVGTLAQAATYINMVRSRPGVAMPNIATPATKNDGIKAVMHERAVELGGECIDNVDIIRWRKKGYFPSVKADPRPGQVNELPIPLIETSRNPLIK